jgi:hypothetical protein
MWMWLVYQWGRAVWAFDHDGAAWVQGFGSVVTALLTAVLIIVTWRYVRLTKAIATISQRQLSASLQPLVDLIFVEQSIITSQGRVVNIRGKLCLKNRGSIALKILAVSILIRYKTTTGFEQDVTHITQRDNRVLMPDEEAIFNFALNSDKPANDRLDAELALTTDCTDLVGISEHSFWRDFNGELRQQFGFRRELSGWRLRWLRFRNKWLSGY